MSKSVLQERLYDPDFRKNRSVPTEPEPIYVREFKSRPPKNLEHVVWTFYKVISSYIQQTKLFVH